MKEDKRLAVITAAVPPVIGFTPERRREAGSQFIDVGIAEEHGVALARENHLTPEQIAADVMELLD